MILYLHCRFLIHVAYMKFISHVFDQVGKMGVPLPASSYHATRAKFQQKENKERFVGFYDDDIFQLIYLFYL